MYTDDSTHCSNLDMNNMKIQLRSVAGPVNQANGRLGFEDDSGSGGLLYCVSQ